MFVFVSAYVFVCMSVIAPRVFAMFALCLYMLCKYICVCVCVCVCVYIYVCVCVYMYVCVCVCVCL